MTGNGTDAFDGDAAGGIGCCEGRGHDLVEESDYSNCVLLVLNSTWILWEVCRCLCLDLLCRSSYFIHPCWR